MLTNYKRTTKPQAFFLHFAGGNAYSYQFLTGYLDDFEVIQLELPGRGKRIKELLIKDFDLAAKDLFNQIINKLNGQPFFLYGHSLGAYFALRVSNMLKDIDLFPSFVFVSGNPGPEIKLNSETYLLNGDEFKDVLKTLGGMPEEIFNDDEFYSFHETILRADFELAAINNIETETPIRSPLYAMMGNSETNVTDIANWKKFTESAFRYRIFLGNHFFIYNHPKEIAKIIKCAYDKNSFI